MLTLLGLEITNRTALLILMIILLVLLVLLMVLGIVFIVALRKRAPVIKVVMAPPKDSSQQEEDEEEPVAQPVAQPVVKPAAQPAVEEKSAPVEEPAPVVEETVVEEEPVAQPVVEEQPQPVEAPTPVVEDEIADDDDDEEGAVIVTEGKEKIRYDRSFNAKIIQIKDEAKEWYSAIKNELLSYQKVKCRMSWKRETFRVGRMNFARIVVRGKTLCLLLAIETSGLQGTKFTVEDVSSVASTADTPCQYRIKSARRVKYAKELIAAVMKEMGLRKVENFVAQDYYLPYEGTVALMERGLIKRVSTDSTRTFEIREVSGEQSEDLAQAAATTTDAANGQ